MMKFNIRNRVRNGLIILPAAAILCLTSGNFAIASVVKPYHPALTTPDSISKIPDRGSRIQDPESRFTHQTSPNSLSWAGGMNAVQFCELDLNRDGTMDLLAFDRHGNRIIPLVYSGSAGSVLYYPDTSYISQIPGLHDWLITADYNCDGLMDIFTYGLGGIRVFRNVSVNTLKFELVTNMLTSWFYSGYIGILVTPVDYPAIADIDGDGDLDLLTFFGLGSFVEYHKNLSVEKYGTCDSLDFTLEDNCWGKFKESEGSNVITLNADCPTDNQQSAVSSLQSAVCSPQSPKHTGSTMLAIDLNGDGLKDLVLGDVDFPNLVSLFNGGTADTAFMIAFDTLFPFGSKAVNLFDFPVPSFVDVDHDGLKDLLVSCFDPQMAIPDNYQSVWFYRNTGNANIPAFTFQSRQFFQDEMIDAGSGSYPVFTDLDQDGLTDLLVGCWGRYDSSYYHQGFLKSVNTGRVTFFRNTGESPSLTYSLVTDDLGGLSSLRLTGLYPAFADLNGDGATDLILGQDDGTLAYLENDATGSFPPGYLAPVWKYQEIDVGESSTPQLYDFDADGLTDLIIGEKNGNLNYYRNTGNPGNPDYTFITDSLGKVNVTNYQISYSGYSTPCFFNDQGGKKMLLVGSEEGKVWFFDNIPSDPGIAYTESYDLHTYITDQVFPVRCGWRTAPAIGNITDSSWFDLVAGNWAGGLNYFSQHDPPEVLLGMGSNPILKQMEFSVFPNPSCEVIMIRTKTSGRKNLLRIDIRNLFGQTVFISDMIPEEHLKEKRISTGQLPNGLYLVTLTDRSGRTIFAPRKLIIRH